MLNFNECTLEQLDETFNLTQIYESDILQTWLNTPVEISDFERASLLHLRQPLITHGHDWNEFELIQHFIGPIFSLVNFSTASFSLFAERKFEGTVEEVAMKGRPDGIIASGKRSPKKPYFCFHEYKRFKDPDGDPAGQCLAPMLLAQEINERKHPIYGCYIVSSSWYFMVLQGKEYIISTGHLATRDDIFDIFRVLKTLKQIITTFVEQE